MLKGGEMAVADVFGDPCVDGGNGWLRGVFTLEVLDGFGEYCECCGVFAEAVLPLGRLT